MGAAESSAGRWDRTPAGLRSFFALPGAVPIQKLRREAQEERDGDQAGREIAEGLGGKGGGGGKENGEEENASQKETFAEQGAEQGQTDLSQRGGHVHAHPLDGHKQGCRRVNFDIPHASGQDFAVLGEKPDELGREEGRGRQHEESEAGTKKKYAPKGLLHPPAVPGPQVEADGPLAAQGDAAHGHSDQQRITLDDGRAGDENIPFPGSAVPLEGGVEDDKNHAVQGIGEEGGKAQGQYPQAEGRLEPSPAQRGGQSGKPQGDQGKHAGGGLGQNGGPCRAGNAHIQQENEHRVQDDVQGRPQHNRAHAQAGAALGDEEAVQPAGEEGESRTANIDGDVVQSVRKSGLAGAEPPEEPAAEQEEKNAQARRHGQQEPEAVGEEVRGGFFVSGAQLHGHQGRAAQSHQEGEGGEQGDDGAADPGSRQSQAAGSGDVADEHPVNDAVQDVDQLGQHGGHGQPEQQARYRIPA